VIIALYKSTFTIPYNTIPADHHDHRDHDDDDDVCVCARAFQKWNVEAIDRDIETAPVDPRARVTRAVVIRLPGTY